MKGKTILLIFSIGLFLMPMAYASIFDWITGWVTGETEPALTREQVKCVFIGSSSQQRCYTDDNQFSCSGTETCVAEVSGENGKTLRWKSSCGGEVYTTIDGNGKDAIFKCEQPQLSPQPTTPAVEQVQEQVKCVFVNSNSEQKCYSSDGKACSGLNSCVIEISGERGKKIGWKSSCGGYTETMIDGSDKSVEFKCEIPAIPSCGNGACESGETCSSCPADCGQCATQEVKEQVKCTFLNSNSYQKCYTSDGMFSCSGTESCLAGVYGAMGTKLEWKSSCGGYAYTTIDGNNDYAEFKCQTTTTPTPIAVPIPVGELIKEQVKCVFANSVSPQKCYTDDGRFGCSGTGTCVAYVSGENGKTITWKSTCGGYASTVIDGMSDYAEFKCEQQTPTQTIPISVEVVKEQVKCLFTNSNAQQSCYITEKNEIGCSGTGTCVAEVSGEKGKMLTWKSSCGGYAYTVVDENNEYAEFNCQQTTTTMPVPRPVEPISPVKEQVKCVFSNSDVLVHPHTAMPEKCHTDDGRFGCTWQGNVATEESGKRYAYCVVEVFGEIGTKLTWKSSCGGYAYTVMDGNEEKAEFQCVPATEVSEEQISGKGFRRAYWECYDGTGAETSPIYCKSSEAWQVDAQAYCRDNCYTDESRGITKCGVNSFSVSQECYIDAGKEGIVFATPEKRGGKKFAMPPNSKIGDTMVVYFYSDTCRHCSGMSEEIDKVSKELNIDIKRVNIINEPELVDSYGIKGVPAFLVLRYESDGIKEFIRHGKADSIAIINWITKPEIGVPEEPAEIEKLKEEILICKDSCPLDGKCYPLGYRKEGRYCSDEGGFKEQLKEDSACDNNFECSTNVCIDGKCMSSGFIQKVMNWFKKLFG